MKELEKKVIEFATEKGILPGNQKLQCEKLEEEVAEFIVEIFCKNKDKAKVELGDILHVLVTLTSQLDTNLTECLQLAYDKNSKRTWDYETKEFKN